MENIVIYGIGDLAKTLAGYISASDNYNLVGFVVSKDFLTCEQFCDKAVEDVDNIDVFKSQYVDLKVLVCIGYEHLQKKMAISRMIEEKGCPLANFIHSSCLIDPSVELGVNNIFAQGVIVEPGVKIADGNIFWSGAVICHDVEVGNCNFFAANSTIGGFVNIGNYNFFGFTSCVREKLVLSSNIVLGANSFLNKDIASSGMYYGTPAVLRS